MAIEKERRFLAPADVAKKLEKKSKEQGNDPSKIVQIYLSDDPVSRMRATTCNGKLVSCLFTSKGKKSDDGMSCEEIEFPFPISGFKKLATSGLYKRCIAKERLDVRIRDFHCQLDIFHDSDAHARSGLVILEVESPVCEKFKPIKGLVEITGSSQYSNSEISKMEMWRVVAMADAHIDIRNNLFSAPGGM